MPRKPLGRAIWVMTLLIALALAAWMRLSAVRRLTVDIDETIYLPLAYRYGEMMAPGRWGEILSFRENLEHPPLVKLIYALQLRTGHTPEPNWNRVHWGTVVPRDNRAAFWGPRTVTAVGGILQVLVTGIANPVGAVLLAIDTYHVKYTAEAYLEGIPGLFAVLAVLLFELATPRGKEGEGRQVRPALLLLSAAALGLAAAGKYPYALVGLVLLPFLVIYGYRRWPLILACAGVALAVFLLANPFLWPNPPGRLWQAFLFHLDYTRSAPVRSAEFPWWQPFEWLTRPAPLEWNPGVFHTHLADLLILPFAAVGLPWTVRRRPVWAAWAVAGLLFLVLWPTRWPQYTLLILPALAVCAGVGIEETVRGWWRAWRRDG